MWDQYILKFLEGGNPLPLSKSLSNNALGLNYQDLHINLFMHENTYEIKNIKKRQMRKKG